MSLRKIYREIARENGITLKEVRNDMQSAIHYAYHTSDKKIISYQKQIPQKGEVATPEEVIHFAAKKIREHN